MTYSADANKIHSLTILVGYKCNFSCSHCITLGKTGALFSIESPMDLVLLKDINEGHPMPVLIQHVAPFGAAKKNKLERKHRTALSKLLRKRCPTRGKLIYFCGQGFTTCCSALTLCTNSSRFFRATPEDFFKSDFYKNMANLSMGQIKTKFKISGETPTTKTTSVCTLCEYLFATEYNLSSSGDSHHDQ